MPIKTGLEVLEWAKSQQPQLKVVIVTTLSGRAISSGPSRLEWMPMS